MRIPKTVNISGHEYSVKIVSGGQFVGATQKRSLQILSNGTMGECEFPTRVIRINKAVTGPLRYMVFLHEVRHGYQFENGWAQLMGPQAMELDCEQFVSFILSLKKQRLL